MPSTIDGRTRLRRRIQALASEQAINHTNLGNIAKVVFGMVVDGYPNLQITLEGMTKLTDEVIFLTEDLLLVPDHLRLARGDRVALLPCQGDKGVRYLIHSKLRTTNLSASSYNAKVGFNGDIVSPGVPGGFRGVEISINGGNEAADSVLLILGDSIQITSINGANVVIDGVNFKHHTHPGGGGPV